MDSSSSDDSSSEDRSRQLSRGSGRNLRVEARKYHLRKTKPIVDRFVPGNYLLTVYFINLPYKF